MVPVPLVMSSLFKTGDLFNNHLACMAGIQGDGGRGKSNLSMKGEWRVAGGGAEGFTFLDI